VITFVSLSVVRERTLGTTELFQVAPMNTVETLIGKYAAYTILGGVLAVVLTGGLVFGLGVPFVGSIFAVTVVILLILVASIGIGFIFALLADSDSQAVQYAMLMLLASIFFSGFLLSLERFRGWVSWLAAPIPAAEGIGALRDVMLRGDVLTLDTLLHLGVLAVVFFGISWVMLHLRLRSR
jgi:ABC-2 type transport system permease protein